MFHCAISRYFGQDAQECDEVLVHANVWLAVPVGDVLTQRHTIISTYACCNADDKSVRWHDYHGRGWWLKDGYSSDSKDITLNLPRRNYCFEPSQSYHLWYGEDDHDASEEDNHGTAKTDVLVKLSCPAGFYSPQGEDGCKGISTVVCKVEYEAGMIMRACCC